MVYATYDFYKNSYGGNAIPEQSFSRVIDKAGRHIDYFTFGRITEGDMETYPSISICACEMAELIYRTGENGPEREKKSENIDGYSVSYVTESVDGESAADRLKRNLYSIVEMYLLNTGLLYLGC